MQYRFICVLAVLAFSFGATPGVIGQASQSSDWFSGTNSSSPRPSWPSLRNNFDENGSWIKLGDFSPTFYRIVDEKSPEWADEEATEVIQGCDGTNLETTTANFKHHLDIEGSGRLRDGRVINNGGVRGDDRCYIIVLRSPFGLAQNGCGLIPYHTLAVDPEVVNLGAVVYIPAMRGVELPNGEKHDGLFIANDTGTAIVGNRIDVFVGFENDVDNSLTRSGQVQNMQPVTIYQVDEATSQTFRAKYHGRN